MPLGGDSLNLAAASAARGDRAALEQVLEAIRPMVTGHCRAKLAGDLGTGGADAVAESVCTAILTGLPSRKDADQPFLSYVYEITVREVDLAQGQAAGDNITVLSDRRAARSAKRAQAYGGTVADPGIIEGDASRRMRELLATLPEREREVLMLRLIGGLSAEEAAAALDSTPGVVRLDQHRAMRKLREAIRNRER